MFDHVKFGVSNYPASKTFFLKVLSPLRITKVTEWPPNGVEQSRPGGKGFVWVAGSVHSIIMQSKDKAREPYLS